MGLLVEQPAMGIDQLQDRRAPGVELW